MARILITGSSDGLGRLAARWLAGRNHQVVLHARHEQRARDAFDAVPGAETVLVGDLGDLEATKRLAAEANASGHFDAVIHNAGVYQAPARDILYINTLAPYVLTSLIYPPQRLIYLSSGLHRQGRPALERMTGEGGIGYGDSKLHVVMLAKAVARRWPGVYANAVDPGWVPTKMGGQGAPDDLNKGFETQAWLAVSTDAGAMVTGRYFFHKKETPCHPDADDPALQDGLLAACEALTGVRFPGGENRAD
ncbi:MAG: SDR family NAD(P)-dependent oxidoreductase [Rhodothermales bacterium]|nr:SDR family NAD(P)-dependent oxidoreductase [Rhodothermales bacterium]